MNFSNLIKVGEQMSIVSSSERKADRLRGEAGDLENAKAKISGALSGMYSDWKADEIRYVKTAQKNIEQKISKINTLIYDVASDIVAAAVEIEQEELERKRAEEAREKAEEAAKKAREEAERAKEQQC